MPSARSRQRKWVLIFWLIYERFVAVRKFCVTYRKSGMTIFMYSVEKWTRLDEYWQTWRPDAACVWECENVLFCQWVNFYFDLHSVVISNYAVSDVFSLWKLSRSRSLRRLIVSCVEVADVLFWAWSSSYREFVRLWPVQNLAELAEGPTVYLKWQGVVVCFVSSIQFVELTLCDTVAAFRLKNSSG